MWPMKVRENFWSYCCQSVFPKMSRCGSLININPSLNNYGTYRTSKNEECWIFFGSSDLLALKRDLHTFHSKGDSKQKARQMISIKRFIAKKNPQDRCPQWSTRPDPQFSLLFWCILKSGYCRTDGRHVRKTIIPTGRDCGLAEWINIHLSFFLYILIFNIKASNRKHRLSETEKIKFPLWKKISNQKLTKKNEVWQIFFLFQHPAKRIVTLVPKKEERVQLRSVIKSLALKKHFESLKPNFIGMLRDQGFLY